MSSGLVLPAPTQKTFDRDEHDRAKRADAAAAAGASTALLMSGRAPPYGSRAGGAWIPRTPADFGDGGAFPEIHAAQHPLGMGERNDKKEKSNALALQVDAEGKVKYDAIARQGHGKDRVVFSKFEDLLPREMTEEDDEALQKPNDEEVEDNTERTRAALEKLVQGKISAAMPVRCAEKQAPAQYIRYTPSQQGAAFNSGAKQRIIRMVEAQSDPMEPPKFKTNKKIPRGPPSPPAPVMHSPGRKVTAKEQQEWKIPPCISNWKNARGYTIPLDKRLAADGRGLQQVHINENFAKLAEALYIADRKAREAVEMRSQIEKKLAQKEKEKKEQNLRDLAQKAREERAGIHRPAAATTTATATTAPGPAAATADIDKDGGADDRDALRYERHKDRARERNLARAAPDKRNKLSREKERDISEKIALGMPAAGTTGGDTQFDSRLFNQSKGLDQGFGAEDDTYNVYDKPWRQAGSLANNIYRPSKGNDKDNYGEDLETLMKTSRFVPDKEFSGTDRTSKRDGPVQFERDVDAVEDDPFGLDKFLAEAKSQGGKRGAAGGGGAPSKSRKKD